MNAGQLKKLLADVPDNAIVVRSAPDHSYRPANIIIDTILISDDGDMTEDYGEESTPEAEFGKRLKAIIVD